MQKLFRIAYAYRKPWINGKYLHMKLVCNIDAGSKKCCAEKCTPCQRTGGGPPDKPPYVGEVLQIVGDKNPLVSGIEGLCMKIFLYIFIYFTVCMHIIWACKEKQETAYC